MHEVVNPAEAPRERSRGDDDTVRLPTFAAWRPPPPAPDPAPASAPGDVRPRPPGPPVTPVGGPGGPPVEDGRSPGPWVAPGTASPPPRAPLRPDDRPPPPAAGPGPAMSPGRDRRRLWVVALVSALVGALVAAAVSAGVVASRDGRQRIVARPPVTTPDGAMDIQTILEQVGESVVTIETSVSARGDVFEGAGTGVVLSADGLVMTNAHVIAQSEAITVRTFSGAEHEAVLVGSEPEQDLAVIRIDGVDDLVPAELGSSSELLVGEPVIAIGNALNLGGQPSVTTGIVSAVNRAIDGPDGRLSDLIQTDAAINPGNSGGPLVDSSGAVVGINTAIIQNSQNIGFAIAIDSATPIVEEIQDGGGQITPDTPRLGVTTVPLDTVEEAVREQLEVQAEQGAFVVEVQPDSGADEAGVRAGDVILSLDGEEVDSSERLGQLVLDHEPGDTVEIVIERRGEQRTLTATLGRRGG